MATKKKVGIRRTISMMVTRISRTAETTNITLAGKTAADDGLQHTSIDMVLDAGLEGDIDIGDEFKVVIR